MTTHREQMVNNAMSLLGLEDKWVIAFASASERLPDTKEANDLLDDCYISKMERLNEDDE